MLIRYIIVVLGASAIVVALLLAMNEAANRFSLRDPTRYFTITDFIPAPDAGRRLPDAPPRPAAQPSRPELQYERSADAPPAMEPPSTAIRPSPVPMDGDEPRRLDPIQPLGDERQDNERTEAAP